MFILLQTDNFIKCLLICLSCFLYFILYFSSLPFITSICSYYGKLISCFGLGWKWNSLSRLFMLLTQHVTKNRLPYFILPNKTRALSFNYATVPYEVWRKGVTSDKIPCVAGLVICTQMFGEESSGFTSLIPKICREREQENTFRLSSKTLEGNFRKISRASLKFMARQ